MPISAQPQPARWSPREAKLLGLWRRQRRTSVTIEELRDAVGESAAAKVASALVRKGALIRARPGRYLLPMKHSDTWTPVLRAVAELLRDVPHYVGGDWALFLHDVIDTPTKGPVDVFLLGRRPTRKLAGTEVRFHTLPKEALAYGLTTVEVEGLKVKVSCVERTALDYLDRSHFFGGVDEGAAWVQECISLLNPSRLVELAVRGSTDATRRRLGTLLEREGTPPRELETLEQSVGQPGALISLFPKHPRKGPINFRWGVVENAQD